MQQWSLNKLSPQQQRAAARSTHVTGFALEPTYQRTRTRTDGRTVTQLLFPLEQAMASIADSPERLAAFQEKMRTRLRNINKNPALRNVLTSLLDGRSMRRLVSENSIEFLIGLLYPEREVDAQLHAYREEAGVLEQQSVEGWRSQGAHAGTCLLLPISTPPRKLESLV